MKFTISAIFATILAGASLAYAAEDCSSVVCIFGDSACSRVCELQGKLAGGKCVQRDGCAPGDQICVCGAKKREVIDGDDLLKKTLESAGTTVDKFIDTVFAEGDEDNKEEKRDDSLDKRSVCCSFPDPAGGLCCEAHCQLIGRLEGGQCTANNVCVCG
ncbi:hypothetical protein K4F52_004462 [Lecanicillium sp. MT-2017a]|nr:hypothetical protein K4F52_004462 [Lecanicillium sp. MT-2017a]